jgi:hypothetical protein
MQARTHRMACFAMLALALAVTLAGRAIAQADPNLGTWKLNLAKSRYNPGPPPVSDTRVFAAWERDGFKETGTVVRGDGTRATLGFSAHYDGKDCKYTGSPNLDTIAVERVDVNTTALTLKRGGKVVGTGRTVVSDNGRTRTVTMTTTNAKGQKVDDVRVYDKQ